LPMMDHLMTIGLFMTAGLVMEKFMPTLRPPSADLVVN